jgi:type IV pilus assembly protein PilB
VTLEDPVEYFIDGVNQSQIRPEIGYTFSAGLRSILRQDPNIIMVGEIRDNETAELAIHAALTGHLVLSTLHTNDAIGAVPRLVDMGVESFLLASSLQSVAAQRLVRKICEKCKVEMNITDLQRNRLAQMYQEIPLEEKKGVQVKG